MMEQSQMWEVIDLVIKEEQQENEAIAAMGSDEVIITYAGITDHRLHEGKITMNMFLLRVISVPTLRDVIKEVIGYLRSRE